MPFPLLIPSFFFSSWLLMVFWGMVSPDVGVATVGYPKAMLATIGIWLVVFPLARRGGKKGGSGGGKFQFISDMGRQRRRDQKKDSRAAQQTLDEDEISITSSFNGITRLITSQNFKGGNIATNFGGVQLDLTGAKLAPEGARIDVRAFVGGVEFTLPPNWNVDVDVSATIGGVNDERDHPGSPGEGTPTLTITGSATVGGISLKD